MTHTALVVLTGKNVGTLVGDGGASCWPVDKARAEASEYVVCCWNARSLERQVQDAAHGEAFLIGHVAGTSPCKRDAIPGRSRLEGWCVKFDRYALLAVSRAWPGGRPPWRYIDDVEGFIGQGVDRLGWHRL